MAELDHKAADNFFSKIRARLEVGAREYGDKSLEGPLESTLADIEEEVLDVCGWSYILWMKLQRLKKATEAKDSQEDPAPEMVQQELYDSPMSQLCKHLEENGVE